MFFLNADGRYVTLRKFGSDGLEIEGLAIVKIESRDFVFAFPEVSIVFALSICGMPLSADSGEISAKSALLLFFIILLYYILLYYYY